MRRVAVRSSKSNAISTLMWREIGAFFSRDLQALHPGCRCVLLTGEGKHFSAGIDLASVGMLGNAGNNGANKQRKPDTARRALGASAAATAARR